jgi:hypothetical protein
MQFTPQQLAGGIKFSPVTRIGNWQEELVLEENKVSNFKKRSESGNLSLRKQETKMSACNATVPYTYSEDGIVRFGDSVILEHDSTSSVLMCDPFECVAIGQEKFLVSTMKQNTVAPRARNVFRITRPKQSLADFSDDPNDPVLRVGQPFLLACSESLLDNGSDMLAPTLYLSSTKKNERTCTKRTNRQMVYMSTAHDAEAVWQCILPSKGRTNASERFLANGHPLDTSVGIQITHRQTNMYLTCDPQAATGTEFGVEYECYADRSAAAGKLGLLVSEFKGASTGQTLSKPDAPVFSWHVVMSSDPSSAQASSKRMPPEATPEVILASLKDSICLRGIDGFWALRELFQNLERQLTGKGKIDREDLKAALVAWGMNVRPRFMDDVIDLVDKGKMALIDLDDFRHLLRGPLAPAREGLLLDVWSQLPAGPSGGVPLDELASRFNGQDHPLVSIGGASEKDALNHFLRSLEVKGNKPKAVSFEKFADYYADLSAAIDDDSYFAGIVQSNWTR